MRSALPWYKREPQAFFEATIGMRFEDKAAYGLILDLIYARWDRLPDDPRYISGQLGLSVRKWNSIRSSLIEQGKLTAADGILKNARASKQIAETDKQRSAMSKGGQNKPKEELSQDYLDIIPGLSLDKNAENESKPLQNKDLDPSHLNKSKELRVNNPPNGGYKRARAKPPPSEADFDLFWEAYGKLGSRQQALKKWNAAIKSGHDPTEIITAAKAHRAHLESPKWLDTRPNMPIRKHGATWLHNQCWKDELEPIPKAQNGNRNTIHDHCSIDELVERAGLVEGDLDAGSGGDSSIIDANWRIIN